MWKRDFQIPKPLGSVVCCSFGWNKDSTNNNLQSPFLWQPPTLWKLQGKKGQSHGLVVHPACRLLIIFLKLLSYSCPKTHLKPSQKSQKSDHKRFKTSAGKEQDWETQNVSRMFRPTHPTHHHPVQMRKWYPERWSHSPKWCLAELGCEPDHVFNCRTGSFLLQCLRHFLAL